ncbi:hypothetical protein HFP15_13030 [Amycolatopsis sp. K13G38]|uniref:DUF997 family protein n=1 Tax=Amycolatopsis acididurans TaxID=2724524 RepID=A0ABX1J638_9PSEU|nr:hypothetical protein [Amycolatopsis acididurans]NKQ53806.1 hypothetical protein [Amycolatopsis acididurans]
MTRTKRVAVTSPQTRLARGHRRANGPWRPPRLDGADTSHASWLYRRQRGRALLLLAALAGFLCGVAVLFKFVPGLDHLRLLGMPLSWLMLGALPFPVMVTLTLWQLRRAERLEDEP